MLFLYHFPQKHLAAVVARAYYSFLLSNIAHITDKLQLICLTIGANSLKSLSKLIAKQDSEK
jgi:hypothetical protein